MAVVGIEWVSDRGLHNQASVISQHGEVLGEQTKNQITPDGESDHDGPYGEEQLLIADIDPTKVTAIAPARRLTHGRNAVRSDAPPRFVIAKHR